MDERAMETMAAQPQNGYRVLARKYRPTSFADLIGQEAMVRTLRNAFASNRLAHAYMLTGVRGVGKTTTARILARAFNYSAPGHDAPTLDMPQMGVHCEAILDSRHMDVIEMDAASHTGIDDIRDIIDSAAYRPVAARYKVFIIDEVHMLSRQAFNGLLKTLEEPPDHVKFVFATTEIRKVPITVLSRCQRFDLRRIPGDLLARHLASIAESEEVTADEDALALIARAAEGSVRDALSILDQAIAHGGGAVEGAALRSMLGVADRGRTLDLFETVMHGDVAAALAIFDELYVTGADPLAVIDDLAEAAHLATRFKLAPELGSDQALNDEERRRGAGFAEALPVSALSRAWQVLLKGHGEVETASRPAHAAEMVLVRLAHMATMPTPEEALRKLGEADPAASAASAPAPGKSAALRGFAPAPPRAEAPRRDGGGRGFGLAAQRPSEAPQTVSAEAAPAIRLTCLEDVIALAEARRDIPLKRNLERFARPVRFSSLSLEFALEPGGPVNIYNELSSRLKEWTGQTWMVSPSREPGADPLDRRRREQEDRRLAALKAHPAVAAVMAQFPDAEMIVRELRGGGPEGLADPEAETDPQGE